ncbi:MAG: pyridoxal phosphate-dependent aminotransferase [Leptospiraceae bacterium]|nr:pyridoxal phosphate-dependent aminotransferase [Leptospiraceae bacterium]MCP5496576.1 pyridoxal phosphate-dependent aminotransferase [Leptospiraceae bacterium]
MILKANILDAVEPSPTLAITAKAKAMKDAGKDVVGFGAGEPDFDTPEHIKEAAKKAMDKGLTKYTPVSGIVSLRDAIIQKFERDNNLKFDRKNIIVGTGGKQVIYNFFMATLNPGDEVIVPGPYWVSYCDIVSLAGGKPVVIDSTPKSNFQITAKQLEEKITNKTKVLILNSPSNPTGTVYTKTVMEEMIEVVLKHNMMIMTDDIYEKIIYDGVRFYNPAMLSAEVRERTFIVNGVSKSYSMTGWRIGYGAGHPTIIENMDTVQGQSTSNASSISQAAAEEAIKGDQSFIQTMVTAFDDRRKKAVKFLNEIQGISCNMPQGAFYVFPYINEAYELPGFQKLLKESGETSKSKFFCAHLLEKYLVAAVPGIAFGDDNAIRISYAISQPQIDKGLERIRQMIKDLS